ncbi:RNA polymerase sigma factor [Reichenbachiella sp.]
MKLDLNEIVQSLRKGDNSCLKIFFQEYGDYCTKNLIKKTSCTAEDADDIFVDAIINLRERLLAGKVSYLTNTKGYLYSTCYNMWLVKYRKHKVHEAHAEDIKNFYDEPSLPYADQEELLNLVTYAINTLGDKCQNIIKLFYLNKLTMEEIASEMGFASAGVAKTIKGRCYKKLIEEVRKQTEINNVFSD